MRKATVIMAVLLSCCLIGGAAFGYQYSVLFDPDAGGTDYNQEQIWGWDLEASIGEQTLGTTPVDFITHQQLGADGILNAGDTFYEEFTIALLNGVNAGGEGPTAGYQSYFGSIPSNLYLDVAFTGYIINYSDGGTPTTASDPSSILDDSYTSIFNTGSPANLYVDANSDKDYVSAYISQLRRM